MARASAYLLLLVVTLFVPATVSGQWQQQLTGQIEQVQEHLATSGYRLSNEAFTGSLDEGAQESIPVTLEPGREYMIVAVCDLDCSDIDLRLHDDNGNEVTADVELDDLPVVEAAPRVSMTYSVQVIMANCTADPCFYGVRVFAKSKDNTVATAMEGTRSHSGELRKGDETLTSGEYVDVYHFEAHVGQTVLVDLMSSAFDPYLILRQPNGKQDENDDYQGSQGHSRVEVVAGASGEWQALVTTYQPGEGGEYELRIGVWDEPPETPTGSHSRRERGSLSPGDQTISSGEYADVFVFDGAPGDHVTIELQSDAFDPYLIVRAPSGIQYENDDYEGDATRSAVSLTLIEGGRHTITVTSFDVGETGVYELRIDQAVSQSRTAATLGQRTPEP
jgi:hypothetical protein